MRGQEGRSQARVDQRDLHGRHSPKSGDQGELKHLRQGTGVHCLPNSRLADIDINQGGDTSGPLSSYRVTFRTATCGANVIYSFCGPVGCSTAPGHRCASEAAARIDLRRNACVSGKERVVAIAKMRTP